MQFKPVLFKAQVYMDVYNQPTQKAAMQMTSGTTRIVTLLGKLSLFCISVAPYVSFILSSQLSPTNSPMAQATLNS